MIRGLDPERIARLAALVSECRPLLAQDGMEAVQTLLVTRQIGVMDSILVTVDLLGTGPGALGEAKAAVLLSAARTGELEGHRKWVSGLLDAAERDDAASA
jgi:hypothetical protein